jgi:hypothetical protein
MEKINMEKLNNVTGGIGSIPITYTTKYPFAAGRKELAIIPPEEKRKWII